MKKNIATIVLLLSLVTAIATYNMKFVSYTRISENNTEFATATVANVVKPGLIRNRLVNFQTNCNTIGNGFAYDVLPG